MKVYAILCLIFLATTSGFTQSSGIKGTVFDRNGAVVTGIEVIVTGDKKSTFNATTDAEGKYSFKLPVGVYSIQVGDNRSLFCPVRFTNYTIVDSAGEGALDVVLAQGLASHARNNCKIKIIKF